MRQQVNYALLQGWYTILQGGLLILLLLVFFLGKSEATPRFAMIPLILVQVAGLAVANAGLSMRKPWGPLAALIHCALMCILTLATLPFRASIGPMDVALPLILHGGLAVAAYRTWRTPTDPGP